MEVLCTAIVLPVMTVVVTQPATVLCDTGINKRGTWRNGNNLRHVRQGLHVIASHLQNLERLSSVQDISQQWVFFIEEHVDEHPCQEPTR